MSKLNRSELNRRELLTACCGAGLGFIPVCARGERRMAESQVATSTIIAGADCLSGESAAGYRRALKDVLHAIVLTGVPSERVPAFERVVRGGATLIYESPASFEDKPEELYVRFAWPHAAMLRGFGVSFCQPRGIAIAHCGTRPVAWRERVGRGSILTLATLVGPHLWAGDRDAAAWLAAAVRP